VRINWNNHSKKLQDFDTEEFVVDSLVKFLCRAAFPDPKYSDIKRSLLDQALKNSGNVKVSMDGFDEICPTREDKAAAIVSTLRNTKVERVWVTSRPVEKDRLENMLYVTCFSMKKLSRKSQVEVIRNLWKLKAGDEKQNLDDFLIP
jgi:hypothetical protein